MVLKVYGFPVPCAQLVLFILLEKQIPFEYVPVDLGKAAHKGREYLENQPFGLVPFIDDDGFILYESRAIVQYLEKKYPDQGTQGLIPKDLRGYARFLQAASIENNYFTIWAQPMVFQRIFKPFYTGEPCDERVYNDCLAKLTENLDVYDSILAKQKYLAGDEITLADLYHVPVGTLLPLAGSNVIQTRPNVSRWLTEISSRKAWQDVQAIAGVVAKPTSRN